MSKENPGINCNLCLRCVNCAMLLANRGSRLKEMLRRRDNNFLLVEVYLLKQILTDNDASNMENFLRKKAAYLSFAEVELKTKIKSQLEFYKEAQVYYMLWYYIYIMI